MTDAQFPDHPDYPYAKHPDFQGLIILEEFTKDALDGEKVFEGTLGAFLDSNIEATAGDEFQPAEVAEIVRNLAQEGEAFTGMGFRIVAVDQPGLTI